MAETNPAAYAMAQERVRAGYWVVDSVAGHVTMDGQRVGGFTRLGYVRTSVWIGGRKHQVLLHRVIWESVHGPASVGLQINHRNGVKGDNRLANLELVTAQGNTQHAYAIGLRIAVHTHCRRGHELVEANVKHKANGERQCRICLNASKRRSYWAQVAAASGVRG